MLVYIILCLITTLSKTTIGKSPYLHARSSSGFCQLEESRLKDLPHLAMQQGLPVSRYPAKA